MNGLTQSQLELAKLGKFCSKQSEEACDILICPPATLLSSFKGLVSGSRIQLGAQDCHRKESGAHTGDLSAEMLKDVGASWIIVGHSERRTDHGETDADVLAKAEAVLRAGCGAIICIGETESDRDSAMTLDVIGQQLNGSLPKTAPPDRIVIAYEPVWAIGTGRTPTKPEIQEVHNFIRAKLSAVFGADSGRIRILYGGSVKPSNANQIFAIENVDGGLIGGASLKADDLWGIVKVYG